MKNKFTLVLLSALYLMLNCFFAISQSTTKRTTFPFEKIENGNNPSYRLAKKTSPSNNYRILSQSPFSSSIFTYQVNVNLNQQNILGDAANEPSIAVNPLSPSNIAIGWRQFDTIGNNFRQAGWSYSVDSGQTWNFPGVIDPGVFRSDPVLDFDVNGIFYYNSLTIDSSNNYLCRIFKSNDGGASWDTGTSAGGGDKQWMTIDRTTGVGAGNIYACWSSYSSSCSPGSFTRSTNGGISYENCTTIDGDPYLGTMAVGNAGELYISSFALTDSVLVAKSIDAQTPGSSITWNTPVYAYMDVWHYGSSSINIAGILGQVNIDVDRSNGPGRDNVYMLLSTGRLSTLDSSDVMFVRSTDGGLTWSSPIRINDDSTNNNIQWLAILSVAPNGRIDAVWLDTRDGLPNTHSSALYYSYSIDQGNTWSVNEKLSASFDPHVGYPNQQKMGDYFDMISENNAIHLAWANTLNGEQDVYYSYILPPVSTQVNELPGISSISIFPNPSDGILTIKGKSIHSKIEVFNIFGESVDSFLIEDIKATIDISHQPAGVYFIKVMNLNGASETMKIIKVMGHA